MKLEAGKYYRTRDGRKAFVAAVGTTNPFDKEEEFAAFGYVKGSIGIHRWSPDGRFSQKCPAAFDLVSEWQVTREVEVVLIRYLTGEVVFYTGPRGSSWRGDIIARKIITITEGDGVDSSASRNEQ